MVQSSCLRKSFRTDGRALRLAAAGICVWNIASSVAKAEEAHPRAALKPAQIMRAMEERKMPTRGVQVRLAASITAAVQNPELEVEAITALSPREVRLRIVCSDRSQCLPFFALATYPEDVNPANLAIKPERRPAGGAPSASAAHAASVSAGTSGKPDAPVLHSGSAATLGFDGERVHVRIAVICLESGAPGEKIRVTSRDHKQVYIAEVVAPTLLKGTF